MKSAKRAGYPQWKCQRCELTFTEGNNKQAINFPNDNCTFDVTLYDGKDWQYTMMYKPHNCKDTGIGVAVLQGLSPNKLT